MALLLAITLIFTLASCGDQPKEPTTTTEHKVDAPEEKTVTVAMMNAWDSMMPMNSNSNYGDFVFDQIYERLIESKADGTYTPQLAKSWEVNADSTEITFHLSEEAQWHDHTPVTAEDVVFTINLYSNPEVNAVSRYYLNVIAGTDDSGAAISKDSVQVSATDKHTVTFTMKTAMYPGTFLMNLEGIPMIAKHIFDGKSIEEINAPDLWTNPIGSGPYVYQSKIDGERMEFLANENYHLGTPKIKHLLLRVIPANNLLAALMSKEVDVLAGTLASIPLDDWEMTQQQTHIFAQSVPSLRYQTLILNTQNTYMTQNVRQAISMAVNRKVIVDSLLKGEGTPIITPIVPHNAYYNENVNVWYDPQKAQSILEEEKFPMDQELTFLVPSGNVTRERAAVLIQQDLQKIGLKVSIKTVDFPTLMNEMRAGNYDIGIIASGGSPDPGESRQMIEATSPVNFSLYKTSELSDIIDAGNAELTFEKRLPHFKAYQEKVKEISAMPYLYSNNDLMAYNKRVKNIDLPSFGVMSWKTWTWDISE